MKNETKTLASVKTKHDRKKLSFNGQSYGKGRVVLAVVEKYIADHPTVTYQQLKEVFPNELHTLGLIRLVSVLKRNPGIKKRYFVDHVLKLKDKTIAVCSDFGKNNIGKFLKHATGLGYKIKLAV